MHPRADSSNSHNRGRPCLPPGGFAGREEQAQVWLAARHLHVISWRIMPRGMTGRIHSAGTLSALVGRPRQCSGSACQMPQMVRGDRRPVTTFACCHSSGGQVVLVRHRSKTARGRLLTSCLNWGVGHSARIGCPQSPKQAGHACLSLEALQRGIRGTCSLSVPRRLAQGLGNDAQKMFQAFNQAMGPGRRPVGLLLRARTARRAYAAPPRLPPFHSYTCARRTFHRRRYLPPSRILPASLRFAAAHRTAMRAPAVPPATTGWKTPANACLAWATLPRINARWRRDRRAGQQARRPTAHATAAAAAAGYHLTPPGCSGHALLCRHARCLPACLACSAAAQHTAG